MLRKLNRATLTIAVVVYTGLLGIAIAARIVPVAIFGSCVMMAEVLVFQFVRTWCDHVKLAHLESNEDK
jgi:hypothetical protein